MENTVSNLLDHLTSTFKKLGPLDFDQFEFNEDKLLVHVQFVLDMQRFEYFGQLGESGLLQGIGRGIWGDGHMMEAQLQDGNLHGYARTIYRKSSRNEYQEGQFQNNWPSEPNKTVLKVGGQKIQDLTNKA